MRAPFLSLRAVGRVVRTTRRTAYAEGQLTDADGNALASASGTFFLTDTLRQQDRERVLVGARIDRCIVGLLG